MVHYFINKTEISVNENIYDSYGIDCRDGECIIASVKDISIDKASVEKLADKCNSEQLSPAHFMDIVEDSLV